MCRDTQNVEQEMCDYNGDNWNNRCSNTSIKEEFGSHISKHSMDSLQQTAILEISHIMREVL